MTRNVSIANQESRRRERGDSASDEIDCRAIAGCLFAHWGLFLVCLSHDFRSLGMLTASMVAAIEAEQLLLISDFRYSSATP